MWYSDSGTDSGQNTMDIQEYNLQEKVQFDDFVRKHPFGTIHQTYEWGDFQAKSSKRDKFWMLVLEERTVTGRKILGTALLVRQKLPFGLSWLYCPRGPLMDYENEKQIGLMCGKIMEIAKRENAVFLRMDPPVSICDVEDVVKLENCYKAQKLCAAHAEYMPGHTLMIDLSLSEDQILKQMKPKGRYNIKVAERHGVTVDLKCMKDIDVFYKLFNETTERDGFNGHPKEYYRNMLDVLGSRNAKLWIAYLKEKPLAAAIVTYFKDTATYYFGASSGDDRNVMAPYLLHWEIMRDAKKHGYKHYDLFGIAPDLKGQHPWATVSEFKLKFGGKRVDYLPARELVFKPFWYALMKLAKHLKGRFH